MMRFFKYLCCSCSFGGCEREFPTHGKLKHHEGVHAGYPCEDAECNFNGKTWTEYLNHRQEHTVKVQCVECKKLFNHTSFLCLLKLCVHSGEKKNLSCPKEGCEKTFTRSFNLESFVMKGSLRGHGVLHNLTKKKLKKLYPKKNQRWRVAEQLRLAAAAKRSQVYRKTNPEASACTTLCLYELI